MADKLKIEVTAPNIEQLEALTELMRDIIDELKALGANDKTASEFADRFVEILFGE